MIGSTGSGISTAISKIFVKPDNIVEASSRPNTPGVLSPDQSETSELTPQAKAITFHEYCSVEVGYRVKVIDSPGFGSPEYPSKKLSRDLAEFVKTVDLLLYCWDFNATRVSCAQLESLKLVNRVFGPEVWDKAVFLFTFTDVFNTRKNPTLEDLTKRGQDLMGCVKQCLGAKDVSRRVLDKLPFFFLGDSNTDSMFQIHRACLLQCTAGYARSLSKFLRSDNRDVYEHVFGVAGIAS